MLRKIASQDWEYALLEDEQGEKFMDVVCGTVGLWNRRVRLTPEEYARAIAGGVAVRDLVRKVRNEPHTFAGRYQDGVPFGN